MSRGPNVAGARALPGRLDGSEIAAADSAAKLDAGRSDARGHLHAADRAAVGRCIVDGVEGRALPVGPCLLEPGVDLLLQRLVQILARDDAGGQIVPGELQDTEIIAVGRAGVAAGFRRRGAAPGARRRLGGGARVRRILDRLADLRGVIGDAGKYGSDGTGCRQINEQPRFHCE